MSTALDVATLGRLKLADAFTLAFSFGLLYVVASLASSIYNAFYGPLSKYPGPVLRALTVLPKILSMYNGTDKRDYIALHQKYGPVVRISPNELSYAGSSQAWKDVYGFKKQGKPDNPKPDVFYGRNPNKVPGIIHADDATHSRQRKAVSHAFSDKSLRDLEPMLKRWAQKMKTKLAERTVGGSETDMLKFYNCTTFDIMSELSFGEGLGMLDHGEYSSWVQTIFGSIKRGAQLRSLQYLGPIWQWLIADVLASNPLIRGKQMEHWNYTTSRVDRRLTREPEEPDLWTKILEKSTGPDALSVPEHHSIASLFMIAGTETTATALSGTTYHLLRNPDMLARLTAELRGAYACSEDVSLDSLARLPYLAAVLREGLRMYPPVPSTLPRQTPKGGAIICGEYVPEDTIVGVHQLASYRMPGAFARPDEFRPERWMGAAEFANDRLDVVEPFSVGPRNCLGKNLAWHELRLLLATVLLEFDLSLCAESEEWVEGQKVFLLWEKVPLMCTLTPVKA